MSTARRLHHTYAEYLALEKLSPTKHEYLNGEIYAMAGGTPEHGFLTSHLAALLTARLPKSCRVGSSDVKVNVLATGLSAYPDGSVFCGELKRDRIDANALTNPTLLFEITSPSTEDYDRGAKLEHYQTISSLTAVLIVAQQEKRVTVVTRNESAWETRDYRAGDRFSLPVPAVELAVDEIYSVLDGL